MIDRQIDYKRQTDTYLVRTEQYGPVPVSENCVDKIFR